MTFKFNKLAVALATAALSTVAIADGRVNGRVSDQLKDNYFEGAIVRIDELNLQTSTSDDGRFSFNKVPAGEYELSVSYLGAKKVTQKISVTDDELTLAAIEIGSDVSELENILVIGQAASANKAINQMRSADNLISVITSDSIGQLPDENVSEALQRVAGVFIDRDQGEGRFVGVRGIDPNLNLSSVNGVILAAPDSDQRSVALDVIPSDLVESISVSKTLNADMNAESIGGSINIKSLSAFDRDGLFYKVAGNLNYSELQEENGHKISGTLTNIFDVAGGELGLAVVYSNQERNFGSENVETDGGWESDLEDSGFVGHEEVEARDYEVTREREGFALNLDFRPSEDTLFYSRYLLSNFSDDEKRNRFEFKLDEGDIETASLSNTSHVRTGTELQRQLKDRYEEQEIQSLVLGAETQKGAWNIEGKLGYSEASEEEPNRVDSEFVYDDVARAGYTSIGQTPALVVSQDGLTPSNYELDEIVVENNLTEDSNLTFNFDLKYDLNFGSHPGFIKAGFSLRDREKENDGSAFVYDEFDGETWADFSSGSVDYGLADLGPGLNASTLRRFASTLGEANLNAEDTLIADLNDYKIEEDVTSVYLMSQVDINALRLTYGLRYEATDVSGTGNAIIETDGGSDAAPLDDVESTQTRFESDYSHVLPSINARYNFNDDVIIRAAYYQSLGRPSFGQLNPTFESEIDEGEFAAEEVGNPELDPFEAQNFDMSIEFYPGGIGAVSAGIFYKEIDNVIFLRDITDSVALSDFIGATLASGLDVDEFLQFQNGETADLLGLELAYTKVFENGILLQVNGTFTDSSADYEGRGDLPLVNQADTVGNFIVGYQTDMLSLRLSTTYRSERLIAVADEAFNDLYEDDHSQIDFSGKYYFNDQLQVFFNAKNLSDEPFYAYRGTQNRNGQFEEYGLSYELGVSFRH